MKTEILIVEDESIVALELQEQLKRMGYSITDTCSTGTKAIETIKARHTDLVLMDIILKGKDDGISTAEEIIENYRLPVIFLTAHSDKATLKRALKVSPYGYILKPFRTKDLQITINLTLERYRMEKEVKDNKVWLETILNGIGDAVIATDINGAIRLINPAAVRYTGYSETEAAGKNVDDIIEIKNRISGNKTIPLNLSEKTDNITVLPDQSFLVSRTGQEYDIEGSISAISNKISGLLGFVLLFHDVTDKNKIAEKMANARKLESLGIITGGIAHNFNNMLTGLFGNISLAKLYCKPSSKSYGFLEKSEKLLDKAREISNQLLIFARGSTSPVQSLDVEKEMQQIIREVLLYSHGKHGIEISPDLPKISFNKDQFKQLIINILENALYSIDNNGFIRITCINREIENTNNFYRKGSYVQIEISDNGRGIPPEIMDKLFDPFFTTKENSRGIGLSTAYFLLNNHGGYISAESVPGVETTFKILIPAIEN